MNHPGLQRIKYNYKAYKNCLFKTNHHNLAQKPLISKAITQVYFLTTLVQDVFYQFARRTIKPQVFFHLAMLHSRLMPIHKFSVSNGPDHNYKLSNP